MTGLAIYSKHFVYCPSLLCLMGYFCGVTVSLACQSTLCDWGYILLHLCSLIFDSSLPKISPLCPMDVVSVSTSRSRDGLETHFPTSRSRSRLGLKVKRLGLGPQGLVYKWQFSQIFKANCRISLHWSSLPCLSLLNFRLKYLKIAFKPLSNNSTNNGA